MSPQMYIVLEIAGAGVVLLFSALGALVSLMYLLTNPTIFGEPARERRRAKRRARRMKKKGKRELATPPEVREAAREDQLEEHDRRRRAAALAVAIATAERDSAIVFREDAPVDWRLLHRQLRLNLRANRSRPGHAYDTRRGSRA